MAIYKKVTDLVGNTPILELGNYEEKNQLEATILAKLEYFNPAGSVKDRIAREIILDAWLTIQKFIIFYCPLDGEHTRCFLGDFFV